MKKIGMFMFICLSFNLMAQDELSNQDEATKIGSQSSIDSEGTVRNVIKEMTPEEKSALEQYTQDLKNQDQNQVDQD
jgi:hypothetical protein